MSHVTSAIAVSKETREQGTAWKFLAGCADWGFSTPPTSDREWESPLQCVHACLWDQGEERAEDTHILHLFVELPKSVYVF
jgi:hypothetical protein